MKTAIRSLLAGLLLLCAGCVSQGVKPETADVISAAVRPIAKNIVLPVLQKNPKYEPALLALATAADVAIEGGNLTPEGIRSFVDTLAIRYDLDPQTKILIASGIDDLAKFYTDTYGPQVSNTADPNLRKILGAFSKGIRDGITFYHQMAAP